MCVCTHYFCFVPRAIVQPKTDVGPGQHCKGWPRSVGRRSAHQSLAPAVTAGERVQSRERRTRRRHREKQGDEGGRRVLAWPSAGRGRGERRNRVVGAVVADESAKETEGRNPRTTAPPARRETAPPKGSGAGSTGVDEIDERRRREDEARGSSQMLMASNAVATTSESKNRAEEI